MASIINLNDPRARRTRRLIHQAFVELLGQKDFESITIQDISDHAEMNRTTFYSHFQDKYELLELTLNTMFSDILVSWIPENKEMTLQDLVRNLMLAVCQWQIESGQKLNRKSILKPYIEENTEKQLYTIIFSCINRASADSLGQNRQLEIAAAMLSSSICGIVFHWSRKPQSESPEDLVQHALPFILSILRQIDL